MKDELNTIIAQAEDLGFVWDSYLVAVQLSNEKKQQRDLELRSRDCASFKVEIPWWKSNVSSVERRAYV